MSDEPKFKYINTNIGLADKPIEPEKVFDRNATIRKVITCTVLILLLVISMVVDARILFGTDSKNYRNELSELKGNNVTVKGVKQYVNYIVDTAKIKGFKVIDYKWAENVPMSHKRLSKSKIDLLGAEGFVISHVSFDKDGVYNVKCTSANRDHDVVFFDITKERNGVGEMVYRLLRVY